MRIPVMEGQLDDVDLPGILRVIGLGRQFTGVELRENNLAVGTIFVKAGKIVGAETAGMRGKEAFFELFRKPSSFFHVYRSPTPDEALESLGSVASMVVEALKLGQVAPPAEPATGAPKAWHAHSTSPPPPAAPTSVGRQPAPPSVLSSAEPSPVHAKSPAQTPAASSASAGSSAAVQRRQPRSTEPGAVTAAVLAVASPKGGCGKTTIALNLAISLARQGYRVILLDADVNGDVLSWLDARQKPAHGTFDALVGLAEPADCLLPTILPGLKIFPATGRRIPTASELMGDNSDAWGMLLSQLTPLADVVLIDCPSGMYGTTHQVLKVSTHVLGVLQAEAVARRSFSMFRAGLAALPSEASPSVAGVLLNMLQARHAASLAVLQEACAQLPEKWLLETSIPRSSAFLDASGEGLPVRMMDDNCPPAISWLFDTLGAELAQRLGLNAPSRSRPKSLLL